MELVVFQFEVKRRLRHVGWSQATLARRAGVHPDTVYKLLGGHRTRPAHETIEKITKALDMGLVPDIQPHIARRSAGPPLPDDPTEVYLEGFRAGVEWATRSSPLGQQPTLGQPNPLQARGSLDQAVGPGQAPGPLGQPDTPLPVRHADPPPGGPDHPAVAPLKRRRVKRRRARRLA